jgi:DNA-binding IclR family transcriptional regulator
MQGMAGSEDISKRGSKTLDNGLQVLEVLAEEPRGLTATELAVRLGLHRTVIDRLVRTLEYRGLCRKVQGKRVVLGHGLVALANQVQRDLRSTARPILEGLAEDAQATAHLSIQEGDGAVRALIVVPPRRSRIHVGFREGQVDPLDRGSAGLAISSMLDPSEGERADVQVVRDRGYAMTTGEITPSITGLSAPVPFRTEPELLSVGVSVFQVEDEEALANLVVGAASALGHALLA